MCDATYLPTTQALRLLRHSDRLLVASVTVRWQPENDSHHHSVDRNSVVQPQPKPAASEIGISRDNPSQVQLDKHTQDTASHLGKEPSDSRIIAICP